MTSTVFKEMAERYRDRKTKRHDHFKEFYDGPADYEDALANPADSCTPEQWKQIVDLFLSEKFIARSEKNKANRKKMSYASTQGTKSLAAKRASYVS